MEFIRSFIANGTWGPFKDLVDCLDTTYTGWRAGNTPDVFDPNFDAFANAWMQRQVGDPRSEAPRILAAPVPRHPSNHSKSGCRSEEERHVRARRERKRIEGRQIQGKYRAPQILERRRGRQRETRAGADFCQGRRDARAGFQKRGRKRQRDEGPQSP